MTAISFAVNGRNHDLDVANHHTLLDVVRDNLRLTGTKECCDEGECGACTLIMNGKAVNSCLILAVEADGAEVMTVEGLEENGALAPLQQSFLDNAAAQCGFCIPGQLMAARALLSHNPRPTVGEVKEALAGNLCRCAGYDQIAEAVVAAQESEA